MAVERLGGLRRVSLAPGETQARDDRRSHRSGVPVLGRRDHDWATAWGNRTISVGSSSRDIRLSADGRALEACGGGGPDLLATVQGVGPGRASTTRLQRSRATSRRTRRRRPARRSLPSRTRSRRKPARRSRPQRLSRCNTRQIARGFRRLLNDRPRSGEHRTRSGALRRAHVTASRRREPRRPPQSLEARGNPR